jgi:hypothetical protein
VRARDLLCARGVLFVVHFERHSVGRETKGAARSATAHGEHIGSIGLTPRSAVGVFPDRLLDDVEKCVLVGLVDLYGDCVAHSKRK